MSHTSVVSGAEHSLLILMAALPREAVAGIACPPGDLADRAERLGITVFPLTELRVSLRLTPRRVPAAGWRLIRSVAAVRVAAHRSKATVIHANSMRAAIIAVGANGLGAPPVVAHIRDVLPPGRLPRLLNRAVRRRVRSVVAISHHVAAGFSAGNDNGAPISVIDNPVELRRFLDGESRAEPLLRELGVSSGAPLLGIVGQITSWKGHDTAVRSLALLEPRHADVILLIVGAVKFADPSTRLDNTAFLSSLEGEISRLGLGPRVVFTGECRDIPAVLAALDVLLVPSLAEPFGRTVAEAMAAGTPVIATTVGGPPEIIDDELTGLLAPPGEPARWASAIAAVLDDPESAQATAERARAVALRRFDERLHAKRMLEIFEKASA